MGILLWLIFWALLSSGCLSLLLSQQTWRFYPVSSLLFTLTGVGYLFYASALSLQSLHLLKTGSLLDNLVDLFGRGGVFLTFFGSAALVIVFLVRLSSISPAIRLERALRHNLVKRMSVSLLLTSLIPLFFAIALMTN